MTESDFFSPYRPDGKLYGFICIVTGATQPLGRAITHELAAHGAACIYACDSSPDDRYDELIEEIAKEQPKTKVIGYPYDVAKEDATLAMIDDILNAWGRLDVWVCGAQAIGPASIESTTPGDIQKCFETNSMAPLFALKYAPAAMAKTTPKGNYANAAPKDQKYGSIVVVSSVASTTGGSSGPCFTMSAHAALGVVRAGVSVLKGTGVRINCISAGEIETVITSNPNISKSPNATSIGLDRLGQPQEVARVAGFLASGFSSYITGANLVVDGGASVM